MKILAIFMIVLALILSITPLSIIAFNKYSKFDIKNDTYAYLIEKGYKKPDIKSIETIVGMAPRLSTQVIFEDEPQVIYHYKKDDGEIVQLGLNYQIYDEDERKKYKHLE